MASLNEANVERKFKQVSNTQDSIQSLSLWVIHHKAHHEKIVSIWVKVLKKGEYFIFDLNRGVSVANEIAFSMGNPGQCNVNGKKTPTTFQSGLPPGSVKGRAVK